MKKMPEDEEASGGKAHGTGGRFVFFKKVNLQKCFLVERDINFGMEKIRYKFKGLGGSPSWCDLEIDKNLSIIIVREARDNPGTSVTNFAEQLATMVCREYDLDINKLVWIEENKGYSLVKFIKYGGRLYGPQWTHITEEDLRKILDE